MQTLLDELFAALTGTLNRVVSKSALSQARQKLKHTAFIALNERLLCSLATLLPEPRWRGLRLLAADSTTVRLPPWPENQDEFGVQSDTSGQPYVLARGLGLYATAPRLMLHAVLGRYDDGERALLVRLLPQLDENDLLIVDRGFPAVWLFAGLQQLQRHFLARMDGTQWPEVKALLRSSQTETVFTRKVSDHARRKAKAAGFELAATTLTVRLIKVVLPSGQIEVLATSLLDDMAYPASDFASLYHERWGLEEAFKLIKHRLNVEQFTGELPESIRQDFHAKIFTANLAQALARSAYETLPDGSSSPFLGNLLIIMKKTYK